MGLINTSVPLSEARLPFGLVLFLGLLLSVLEIGSLEPDANGTPEAFEKEYIAFMGYQ